MTNTTAAPSTATAAPTTAGNVSTGDGLTHAQVHQWADQEVKAGRQTRAEADAMLKAEGVPPQAAPSPVGAHLAQIGFAPAKPEQFVLPPLVGPNEPFDKNAQAMDRRLRTWLSTAGLTKEIGSSLVAEVARTEMAYEAMNPAQRKSWEQGQRGNLARIWGADTDKKISGARQLVNEIEEKAPGFKRFLDVTGGGSSASVIAQLAMHAQRLAARTVNE
jgi:hypothetical protein